MVKVYFKNVEGKRVACEVTEEVAEMLQEERRAEWRSVANARNNCTSFDAIEEAGHEFASDILSPEQQLIKREELIEKKEAMKNAMKTLSKEQQKIVYWVYFKNISQQRIAQHLGIDKSSISQRIKRIHEKLKKYFEKN